MKVLDVMTHSVAACGSEANLAEVGEALWANDCGALPVVDAGRRVLGMITDRDVCIAAATRGLAPQEITARSAMSRRLHGCGPEDDVEKALETMRTCQVRRLPVVDADGTLQGMLSLADVVIYATRSDDPLRPAVAAEAIVETLRGIVRRPRGVRGQTARSRTAAAAGVS